jgi:hypothetical protein
MLQAMDDVLLLSMLVKGTSPSAIRIAQEKAAAEAEKRAQEKSREKVQHWLAAPPQ